MPATASSERLPQRLRLSSRALAHAVAPRTWSDAAKVAHADATLAVGVRVGIAVAVVMVVAGLAGYPNLAGFAALGALVSAFARYEPYPRLGWKVGIIGVGVVVFVAAGAGLGLLGVPASVEIGLMGIACGVAVLLVGVYRVTGPGPVVMIFAATAAVGSSGSVAALAGIVLASAVGTVVGWLAAMAPWVLYPMGPARLATARALAALARVERGASDEDVAAAVRAVDAARDVVAASGSRHRAYGERLETLLDDVAVLLDRWSHEPDDRRRAHLASHEAELRRLKSRTELSGFVGTTHQLSPRFGFLRDHAPRWRSRELLLAAVRSTIAALVAGWLALGVGLDHPLWASMGAMAALQGIDFTHTVHRAIQRLAGNIVGALLAAGLIGAQLGFWPTVAVVVVLQAVAEIVVLRNYALTSVAVTAMALLLTGFGAHITPDVAISRVADTLVGVVVGVVAAALTISRSDRITRSHSRIGM
ncbi:FUSC family protein [Rhodococcus rhodnii]|nr:FUSC family protein [Rhodococcus rhodnii]TXG89890.1 FUSC family protein [Rhodococcus rhodnii]